MTLQIQKNPAQVNVVRTNLVITYGCQPGYGVKLESVLASGYSKCLIEYISSHGGVLEMPDALLKLQVYCKDAQQLNSSHQKLYYHQQNAVTPNTKFTTTTPDKVEQTVDLIFKRSIERRLQKLNIPSVKKQSQLKCTAGHLLYKMSQEDLK